MKCSKEYSRNCENDPVTHVIFYSEDAGIFLCWECITAVRDCMNNQSATGDLCDRRGVYAVRDSDMLEHAIGSL